MAEDDPRDLQAQQSARRLWHAVLPEALMFAELALLCAQLCFCR